MLVKCGRKEFDLNKDDVIFDNSFVYQITTRAEFREPNPLIAKTKAKKLVAEGKLTLIKESFEYTTSDGKEVWHRYYRVSE